MRISLLASATALLGLVSAAPMDVEPFELAVTQGNYRWRVTQWQACCSSTACTYKCYVQAPLYNVSGVVIPSFKAKCNGRATKHFVNCQVLSSSDPVALQASLVPLKQPGSGGNGIVSKTMGLSLSFEDKNGVSQNYTGYHQAQYNCGHLGGKNFAVQPSKNVQS